MSMAMGWVGFRVQLYPPTEMYHVLTLPQLAEPPKFAQGARSLPLRVSHNTAFVGGAIHIHARAAEFDDMGFVSAIVGFVLPGFTLRRRRFGGRG